MSRHIQSIDQNFNQSANTAKASGVSPIIWLFRVFLVFFLFILIMPFAVLLTPWWIGLQPFSQLCPNMMSGYYRLITWPLTIGKHIRSYSAKDRFIEQLKY